MAETKTTEPKRKSGVKLAARDLGWRVAQTNPKRAGEPVPIDGVALRWVNEDKIQYWADQELNLVVKGSGIVLNETGLQTRPDGVIRRGKQVLMAELVENREQRKAWQIEETKRKSGKLAAKEKADADAALAGVKIEQRADDKVYEGNIDGQTLPTSHNPSSAVEGEGMTSGNDGLDFGG